MRAHAEQGFTLLEMLVALAVLGLAVLALINLSGENTRTEGLIEERVFASIVADNRAVETLTSAHPPALGETSGNDEVAGRAFRWTRRVTATPEREMLRVDVSVMGQGREQVLSEVTLFRGLR